MESQYRAQGGEGDMGERDLDQTVKELKGLSLSVLSI